MKVCRTVRKNRASQCGALFLSVGQKPLFPYAFSCQKGMREYGNYERMGTKDLLAFL